MIKILFFAQIREMVETKELFIAHSDFSVGDLITKLSSRGEKWRQAFQEKTVLCAVNQNLVETDWIVQDGDEVAFFPPVTGG